MFLKNWFCPFFVLKSFVFFVSIFEIAMYIVSLVIGGISRDGRYLLAPSLGALSTLGMKIPIYIKHGQVWRFLTYTFLHANLQHIVFNLLSQLIIGSTLENLIGFWRILVLYCVSSIGGGLFSSLIDVNSSVGASVAVFGMLGGYLMYLLLNWNRGNPVNNMFSLMMLLMVLMLSISVQAINPTVDNFGHIGGLIYGFFVFPLLSKPENDNDPVCCTHKTWRTVSIVFCIFFYIGGFLLFFLVRNYPNVNF